MPSAQPGVSVVKEEKMASIESAGTSEAFKPEPSKTGKIKSKIEINNCNIDESRKVGLSRTLKILSCKNRTIDITSQPGIQFSYILNLINKKMLGH